MPRVRELFQESFLPQFVELLLRALPRDTHGFRHLRRRKRFVRERHGTQHLPACTGEIEWRDHQVAFFQKASIHSKDREHDVGQDG